MFLNFDSEHFDEMNFHKISLPKAIKHHYNITTCTISIIGCESHIDDSFTSTEVFPQNFTIFHKDQKIGGGGVFICLHNSLNVSEEPSLDSDAELIWARISSHKGQPSYIRSLYRPPDNNPSCLTQLKESLNSLYSVSTTFPNLILAGDFNLPGITWLDECGVPTPNPAYGAELNSLFIDIINDHSLEQLIHSPTRENYILYLVFSTQPDLISEVCVVLGISDHEAVTFSISNSIQAPKKPKHKVFLFHKADLVVLKVELSKFWETFEQSNPYIRTATENWIFFKSFIMDLILKYVPQKNSKFHKNLPWLNCNIKCAMQKRKHLYDHAKLSNLKND